MSHGPILTWDAMEEVGALLRAEVVAVGVVLLEDVAEAVLPLEDVLAAEVRHQEILSLLAVAGLELAKRSLDYMQPM